ncbi:MAG: nucleotidyl transferase AbiEii/AbiGii toxin family protein [Candidatus Rokubacteria bacterium]|nr:nucleotidyl transferase AbiEii/AbiGii toxin family protein [Candidatus Rokubacteria bacterium]
MDTIARLPASERADLFTEAAGRRGLVPAILEKDFWVCWMLKRIFALPGTNPSLIFKGGTSLSKVYSAIRRFSEDIDVSFNRGDLGYRDERDPESASSKKKTQQLIGKLDQAVQQHIDSILLPRLSEVIGAQLGPGGENWALAKDAADPQAVVFRYPPSLSHGGLTYINPVVRLELGARGDPWPTEQRRIKPYAAEEFPEIFEAPACEVTVLVAERTFWEKATLLHAENHRPPDKPTNERLSRHYYDLALLADTEYGRRALTRLDLLGRVVKHKRVYFSAAWAKYEEAQPGSLRLVPREERLSGLDADYAKMAPMIFDHPPPQFEELIARLTELENQINGGSA